MVNTNKLKGYRNECNKKQSEFAEYLGITGITYSRKENGEQEFKESEINKILKLLNELLPYTVKYEDVFLDRKYSLCLQEGD